MLEGFRAIIDGDEPPPPGARAPDAEELSRALQVLLKGQVIYADTQGIGRSYELARHYAPFFTDYFACLGYALTVSHRDQMVSLSPSADAPRHDIVSERLRKDETLVLLALRLLYEEGLRDHRAGTDGIVLQVGQGLHVDRALARPRRLKMRVADGWPQLEDVGRHVGRDLRTADGP